MIDLSKFQAEKDVEQKREDADRAIIDKADQLRIDKMDPLSQVEPEEEQKDDLGPDPVDEELDLNLLNSRRRWIYPTDDEFTAGYSNFSHKLAPDEMIPRIIQVACDDIGCAKEKRVFRGNPRALVVATPSADATPANPETVPRAVVGKVIWRIMKCSRGSIYRRGCGSMHGSPV